MWQAIVFACKDDYHTSVLQSEVDRLQVAGVFPANIPLIVVADPCANLGSGGALLNALLVATEHLCVTQAFTVLNTTVLHDARILVCYMGRAFSAEPCGKAFMPLGVTCMTHTGCVQNVTQLVHTYKLVTERVAVGCPPGVFVCGCDWMLLPAADFVPEWSEQHSITVFAIPSHMDTAREHGVYDIDNNNVVRDIVFRGPVDRVQECAVLPEDQVPLVCSMLHLNSAVTESVLRLHSVHPWSNCTYLGADSGAVPLQLSLFFDVLLPTCSKVLEESFIRGERSCAFGSGTVHGLTAQTMHIARRTLHSAFNQYSTHAMLMPCELSHYIVDDVVDSRAMYAQLESMFIKHCTQYTIVPCLRSILLDGGTDQMSYYVLNQATPITINRDQLNNIEQKHLHLAMHFDQRRCLESAVYGNLISQVLSDQLECSVRGWMVAVHNHDRAHTLLHKLDECAIQASRTGCSKSTAIVARTLACTSDLLAIMAHDKGGLRSGPAHNKQWQKAFALLEESRVVEGMEQLAVVRADWMSTPCQLIRAARHYEAAAQCFVRKTVATVAQHIHNEEWPLTAPISADVWQCASCAARVDWAGGWSDTPPITYECGQAAVTNMAVLVDATRPIGAKCRKSRVPGLRIWMDDSPECLHLDQLQQIERYNDPGAPGALVCAIMLGTKLLTLNNQLTMEQQFELKMGAGFVGLDVCSWSHLPAGSGLGTSSILMGCLLAVVYRVLGKEPQRDHLLHAVLYVEQLLTTGGGWQDQVGGLVPALKIARFRDLRIHVQPIALSERMHNILNHRLLLVYTGKTRLAKNLLQEVVRQWFARESHVLDTVHSLVESAEQCATHFQLASQAQNDSQLEMHLDGVALCARQYWQQKKRMAPGSEPVAVAKLLGALYAHKHIVAGWLAGAAGGGFLYLLLGADRNKQHIQRVLDSHEDYKLMRIHSIRIADTPLQLYTQSD